VYQAVLYRFRVTMFRAQMRVIASAIHAAFTPTQREKLAALNAIGISTGDLHADYLRFGMCAADQNAVIAEIFYQSTVTGRGINEALQRLNYTWRNKPVLDWAVGYTHGTRGDLGVQMRAALRSNLTWAQFCALPGTEQSDLVVFWILEDRLAWLGESNAN